MIAALATALIAVGFGAWIGLWQGAAGRLMAYARSFALASVLTLVCARLLPDALVELGLWALVAFVLAFLAPGLLERLGQRHGHADAGLGLELGYLGLMLHQLGEGFVLGAYAGELHHGHVDYDVLLAVGAHTVPVAALMVLAYRGRDGVRAAVGRAVGLALISALGIGVASVAPLQELGDLEPWMTALVAGLLTHVVAHGLHGHGAPAPSTGFADVIAVGFGTASVLAIGTSHGQGHDHAQAAPALAEAFTDLWIETAPLLLFGLAIGAALQLFGSRIPARWLEGGSDLGQAARGAVIGAPLPLCACGVLPVAESLRARGGGAALVVAFLIATPELGVETFALTVRFLGWQFAWVRLAAAVGLAMVAGFLLARGARGTGTAPATDSGPGSLSPFCAVDETLPTGRRFIAHLDELLHHIGPWTLVGLLAAAYVQVGLDADALAGLAASGFDIPVVMLIAVPSYVCASSATPLAAVLLAKGLSPGAVLAGLLLGPATNIATLGWMRRRFGGRGALWCIGGVAVACGLMAMAVNAWPPAVTIAKGATQTHMHALLAEGAALLLVLLMLRGVWRVGLGPWLGSLGESLNTTPHSDAHGHAGHEHQAHAHG